MLGEAMDYTNSLMLQFYKKNVYSLAKAEKNI